METGIFDIPAPLFGLIDAALAGFLPETIRLIIWGLAAGAGSMGLYWLTSSQKKLEHAKQDSLAARKALAAYDGDFDGVFPLMTRSLSTSFRHFGLALGPALLGSLPVIFLMVWMSGSYGYRLPEAGEQVDVATVGQTAPLAWSDGMQVAADQGHSVAWPDRGDITALAAQDGVVLLTLPLEHPVPVKHKRVWWNMLFANPLGSLPDTAPVEVIEIGLEPQIFLPFGPGWMRGWEAPFILVVLIASVAIKLIFRIR
jgi:hypothetical protein